MSAPMSHGMKVTKSERKLKKKLTKAQNTLLKHDGIVVSNSPTKILCVNNAGLDVGVSREEVESLFSCHGNIAEIIMVPQKPYAFVCYNSEDEAMVAHKILNGTEIAPSEERKQSTVLYIFYVGEVPPSLCPSDERPPGLVLLENFVSEEEEIKILKAIDWEEDICCAQQQELKHRQVKHYGFEFKYGINDVDADDPLPQGLPAECDGLLQRALQTGYVTHYPDQLTVNKYLTGQGIPPHIDTAAAFEDGIMSLSLGSQVLMDFRHPNGKHLSVMLPPRSLLIMTGESRYFWSHGITPRKSDIISSQAGLTLKPRGTRTSLTFRKIIHPKEREKRKIPFFDNNEMTSGKHAIPQSDVEAAKLEMLHVHQVYEEIADHFSGTRHSPWPKIAEFIRAQPDGSLLADIGCGNGKYLGVNPNIFEVGSDRSSNLAKICRERNYQVFVADVMSIPLRSDSFDVCLCIAVLHHLSTEERRLHGLSELVRILRPGGQALIYVWAMEQELQKVKSKYLREVKVKQTGSEPEQTGSEAEQTVGEARVGDYDSPSCKKEDSAETVNSNGEELKGPTSLSTEDNDNECTKGDVDAELSQEDHNNAKCLYSDLHSSCDTHCNLKENSSEDSAKINPSRNLQVHRNRTNFKQQDMLVPWQLKHKDKTVSEAGASSATNKQTSDAVFHRYYHVFRQGELESLCVRLSNCRILGGYYDQGNWAVILQKLSGQDCCSNS